MELRERKVTELVEFLATKEGEVVKVMDLVFTTICNILSNKFFSMDLCDFEDEGRVGGALKDLIHKNAEFGATPNLSDYYPILGGLDIQGINRKAKEMFERIPTTWEDILKERRTQRSNRSSHRDFLEALLEIGFEDDQINQVILVRTTLLTHTNYYSYKSFLLLVKSLIYLFIISAGAVQCWGRNK